MKFINETLFDKFDIDISTKPQMLLKQFQTNAQLRKELPKYVKIINDKHLLLQEQLFSTKLGEKDFSCEKFPEYNIQLLPERERLAMLIGIVKDLKLALNIKIPGEDFNILFNSLYSNDIENLFADKQEYEDFKKCIIEKIKGSLKFLLSNYNSTISNDVFKLIKKISVNDVYVDLIESLQEEILISIETSNTNQQDLTNDIIAYLLKLNTELIRLERLQFGIKEYLQKVSKNNVTGLNCANLFKMVLRFDNKTISNFENQIVNLSLNIISFDNFIDEDVKIFGSLSGITLKLISKFEELNLKKGSINALYCLNALANQSTEDLEKFKTDLKSLKKGTNDYAFQNLLFEICLFLKKITHETSRYIWINLLSEFTEFDFEGEILEKKFNVLKNIVDKIISSGKYMFYSQLKAEASNRILLASDVDTHIYKYYPLIILDSKMKNYFKNFIQMSLYPANMIENVPKQNYGYGYSLLTPIGEFIKDMFMQFPQDWEVDGNSTVDAYLGRVNVYNGSNYGVSKSSKIITKCDNIDKKETQRQSNANNEKSNANTTNNSNSTGGGINVWHPKAFWGTFIGTVMTIAGFTSSSVALGIIGIIIAIISTIVAFVDY